MSSENKGEKKGLDRIPLFRYLKSPAEYISELYDRYSDGGEWGWFAVVGNKYPMLYTWSPALKRWLNPATREVQAEHLIEQLGIQDISDDKIPIVRDGRLVEDDEAVETIIKRFLPDDLGTGATGSRVPVDKVIISSLSEVWLDERLAAILTSSSDMLQVQQKYNVQPPISGSQISFPSLNGATPTLLPSGTIELNNSLLFFNAFTRVIKSIKLRYSSTGTVDVITYRGIGSGINDAGNPLTLPDTGSFDVMNEIVIDKPITSIGGRSSSFTFAAIVPSNVVRIIDVVIEWETPDNMPDINGVPAGYRILVIGEGETGIFFKKDANSTDWTLEETRDGDDVRVIDGTQYVRIDGLFQKKETDLSGLIPKSIFPVSEVGNSIVTDFVNFSQDAESVKFFKNRLQFDANGNEVNSTDRLIITPATSTYAGVMPAAKFSEVETLKSIIGRDANNETSIKWSSGNTAIRLGVGNTTYVYGQNNLLAIKCAGGETVLYNTLMGVERMKINMGSTVINHGTTTNKAILASGGQLVGLYSPNGLNSLEVSNARLICTTKSSAGVSQSELALVANGIIFKDGLNREAVNVATNETSMSAGGVKVFEANTFSVLLNNYLGNPLLVSNQNGLSIYAPNGNAVFSSSGGNWSLGGGQMGTSLIQGGSGELRLYVGDTTADSVIGLYAMDANSTLKRITVGELKILLGIS